MKITIAGAGVFGQSIGKILLSKQHQVIFYDPKQSSKELVISHNLTETLVDNEVLIIAVPAKYIPDFISSLPKNFNFTQTVILASKGICDFKLFQIFSQLSLLSGPAFAQQLDQHQKTTLTATSPLIQDLLQTDWLTIELSDDHIGVLLCGTIKNIYAIGAGFLHLAEDPVMLQKYLTTAIWEMKIIVKSLGGQESTCDLACGIGDLTLTCSSPQSRNYQFGHNLSQDQNYQPTQTTEGLTALQSLPQDLSLPPLLQNIAELVANKTKHLNF